MNTRYKSIPYIVWAVALVATLGSLYFSEIRQFPPCILCWYQRIFIYPLVILIPIGILNKDKILPLYVLFLSVIGLFISIYHNLLYYNVLPESSAPCLNGISCTTKYVEYFGFITIPLLSFITFATIIILMLIYKYNLKKENE